MLRATLEVPSEALLHPQKLEIIGDPIVVRSNALLILRGKKNLKTSVVRFTELLIGERKIESALLGISNKEIRNRIMNWNQQVFCQLDNVFVVIH